MKPVSPNTVSPIHSRARRFAGVVVAGLISVALLAGCLSEDQVTAQTLINNSRSSNGVRKLADYAPSDTKAQNWANYLAGRGSLAHSTLTDGYQSGTWCRLGENVGMGPSLSAIHNAFMNSPSHRANIVNANYDHVGTGVTKRGNTYYVVQEFADLC